MAVELERRTRAEVFGAGVAIAAWPFVLTSPVPPHVHDFIELALVNGGAARYSTGDGTVLLGVGDVVVVRPGAWHAYVPAEGSGPLLIVNAYLGPEVLHGQLAWVLDYPHLARLVLTGGRLRASLPAAARTRVAGWLTQLSEEQERPDRVLSAALLGCALVEISRAEARHLPVAPPMISGPVRATLEAISKDLARPWTVAELAHRAGLSPSSLYRQFRGQLGSGPLEWLTRSRAEEAATLLVQTDLPVGAVGRRVGWADPNYASRRFSQVYDLSPTAYRMAHAGQRRGRPGVGSGPLSR